MTTTTLSSSKGRFFGLYKTAMKRNLGYGGMFFVLLTACYPLQYAMEAFKKINEFGSNTSGIDPVMLADPFFRYNFYGLGKNYTSFAAVIVPALLLLSPLVLALVFNSYMQSKKAADVYHSLPVRRETLLGVNAAAAMTMLIVPFILCNIAISIMQCLKFGVNPILLSEQFLDMLGWIAAMLSIYAVATFVSILVGTVFDAFVYTGVLLCAIPAVWGIMLLLAGSFVYGYQPTEETAFMLFQFSPALFMPCRFILFGDGDMMRYNSAQGINWLGRSNTAIAIYFVFALAMLAAAMWLYKRRKSEIAEMTTTRGILPVIVKFLGTFVIGTLSGLMFYAINGGGLLEFIIWAIIGGGLTYCIMEVILNRGFKTVIKSLPLGAIMVITTVMVTIITMKGGFGYENYVPSVEEIDSVSISYNGRFSSGNESGVVSLTTEGSSVSYSTRQKSLDLELKKPKNLELITSFHKDIVENKPSNDFVGSVQYEINDNIWAPINITYHNKNGKTTTRSYNNMPADTYMKLAALETDTEYLTQLSPAFVTKSEYIQSWKVYDIFGNELSNFTLSDSENAELLEAMKFDTAAITLSDLESPQSPECILQFEVEPPIGSTERFAYNGSLNLTGSSQKTYQYLSKRSLLPATTDKKEPIAVALYNERSTYRGDSAIKLATKVYFNESDDIETVRYEANQGQENFVLLDSPSDAERLMGLSVNTLGYKEPCVLAKFFFDRPAARAVMIPISKMPKDLQEKVLAISETYI